jgi:hypothetical protein
MIPFVISEAHPDYKRPYLSQDFGQVKEEEMQSYFLNRVCDFLLDRKPIEQINKALDVELFFHNYYDEYYMDNSPWEVMVFRNDDWENANPSFETIWEHIQLIKLEDQEEYCEEENVEEKEDKEEKEEKECNVDETNEEAISQQMKCCFEEFIKREIITSKMLTEMQEMTDLNRLCYLLSKLSTDLGASGTEQYNKNKDIYHLFLNLSLKLFNIDMLKLTNQLEKEHNEETMEQIKVICLIANNIVTIKQCFGF